MPRRQSRVLALNLAHIQASRNGLEVSCRQASVEALNRIVIEGMECALAARQAKWNVRGASFLELRGLFAEISDALLEQVDRLAERAAAIGGLPSASAHVVAAHSESKPYTALSIDSAEHIDGLSRRIAHLSSELRQTIIELGLSHDPVTVELMTRACATADRLLWRLESLQEPPAATTAAIAAR